MKKGGSNIHAKQDSINIVYWKNLFVWSQGLINKDTGAPQEMAGLVTHLHYHEPSNFVLVSFLQKGLFHELCEPGENGKRTKNA